MFFYSIFAGIVGVACPDVFVGSGALGAGRKLSVGPSQAKRKDSASRRPARRKFEALAIALLIEMGEGRRVGYRQACSSILMPSGRSSPSGEMCRYSVWRVTPSSLQSADTLVWGWPRTAIAWRSLATFIFGVNPIFTADLRQLGVHQAQLNVGFGWRYTSWNPAGPNTLAMTSLHVFKGWGDRRVEMKAGYLGNDLEFVGLQVGGSTSTGAQGVYAVLPNEVGLSYFPLTAPSLNVRVRGGRYGYVKTAAQRSLDAAGGQSTVDRTDHAVYAHLAFF